MRHPADVLARGARRPARPWLHRAGVHAHHLAGVLASPRRRRRRSGVRAQAVCVPPHHRARRRRQPGACGQDLLRVLHVVAYHRVQGHVGGHADAPLLHRPQRRGGGDQPGACAFALFHEHHAQLGARSSEPLHHPQRRDQHAARQHQLDARPRAEAVQPGAGR